MDNIKSVIKKENEKLDLIIEILENIKPLIKECEYYQGFIDSSTNCIYPNCPLSCDCIKKWQIDSNIKKLQELKYK